MVDGADIDTQHLKTDLHGARLTEETSADWCCTGFIAYHADQHNNTMPNGGKSGARLPEEANARSVCTGRM